MVQTARLCPGRRRLGLCSWLLGGFLVGCSASPSPVHVVAPVGEVVADQFLLSVDESMGTRERQALRDKLTALSLSVEYEFSHRVGLDGSLSVRGDLGAVRALQAAFPSLRVASSVVRHPIGTTCGNGTCDGDEAANVDRGSLCSLDCGALPLRPVRDELQNSFHISQVGADKVWPQSQGAGVTVCIIDTGYDSGAMSMHPDRPPMLGAGYSFVRRSPDYSDVSQHGTHVAGIVAAAKNGTGAVGVAPQATVRMYQVFRLKNGSAVATDADVIAALDAAIGDGCKIINLSLGGASDSEAEHQAIRRAYQSGVLVVAAAGNSEDASHGVIGTAQSSFPGAYPESFTVGAVSRSDTLAGFSGTGPAVGIAAPGVGIYSTVPVSTGRREVSAAFVQAGRSLAVEVSLPDGSSATSLPKTSVASCGFGSPSDIDVCQPAGQVALIQRGPGGPGDSAIPFYDKIRAARQGGAVGVLLYNHRYGDAKTAGALLENITIGGGQPVPVLTLAAGDGEALAERAAQGGLSVSATTSPSDYAIFDGTSMAAPVVSGVAALLWSANKSLSNVELRQLLGETAVDLGAPGRDDQFGAGRIDAARALAQFRPRGVCGDGVRDRASEICDGASRDGTSCDDLGYDGVVSGEPGCNASCTALSQGTCACVPGRTPFAVTLGIEENSVLPGGLIGTRFRYHVELSGKPVTGARIVVSIGKNGQPLVMYRTPATDALGNADDFIPYDLTGLPAGDYQVSPMVSKGDGLCRDEQPTKPAQVTVRIRS